MIVLRNSANSVTGDRRRGDYGVPSDRANTACRLRQQVAGNIVPQEQLATHIQQISDKKETKDLGENFEGIQEYINTCTILKNKELKN